LDRMVKDLVPITREVLRAFYAKNPLLPVPKDVADALAAQLDERTGGSR
jgi:hypothetical protein